jgi:hypothetical protein
MRAFVTNSQVVIRQSLRMFKKIVRRGRSERKTETYSVRYVEVLSDARTKPAVFFNVRLVGEDYGTNQPLGATRS